MKQIYSLGSFPEVGQKQKTDKNRWPLPNAGNKKKKKRPKISFFCIYLLVMPKYWRKQIFTHRSFPEVGQKQKTERKREKRKKVRLNDGNNNGQLRIATPPEVAHAKPPGPKYSISSKILDCWAIDQRF